jgi:serine/threonine-protein kinase RsbW
MPSGRPHVAPTVDRILQAIEAAGLDQDQRDDLAVAVAEALSNAAVHGNHLKPETEVLVSVETVPHRKAVVEIEDSGPGFNRKTLGDPTDPAHLLDTRGRGVFLMRRLVDRLEYNTKGNRVRLTMERRSRRRQQR